jgi:steroid delta-isomerase-like uncharacterized protein
MPNVPANTFENKKIVQRFAEVWSAGGLAIVDELASPDILVAYPFPPEPMRGREAFKDFLAKFFAALPDVTVSVDDMVAEGDKVAARWSFRGTHNGPLFGCPPTGRTVEGSGQAFYRVIDGKVVEEIGVGNTLGVLLQIGAVQMPVHA